MKYSDDYILYVGEKAGIDFDEIDPQEFITGFKIELEHGLRDSETNVTNDHPLFTAKIAWAHLKEIPDYYTRLIKMEEEAKEDMKTGVKKVCMYCKKTLKHGPKDRVSHGICKKCYKEHYGGDDE